MLPPLRLGVELPPVPTGSAGDSARAVSLEPWWQLLLASVRAGAGVVWFTGGPTAEEPRGNETGDLMCDACTIAAAAVSLVDAALLGVVSEIPVGRHPAVLARDVTTLDVLSDGRAAVLLRWGGTARPAPAPPAVTRDGPPLELSAACQHLGEAVAVCRSVLQDDDPVFEGTYLHVAGAVNRPPPRRPGGPPLFVEVPAAAAGLVGHEAGLAFLLRQAASSATAVVCSDDPGEVASWRALLEEAAASRCAGRDPGELAAVVCRTTPPPPGAAPSAPTRSRLEAAREAGASGVILRVRAGWRRDAALHLGASDPEPVVSALAESFGPWLG